MPGLGIAGPGDPARTLEGAYVFRTAMVVSLPVFRHLSGAVNKVSKNPQGRTLVDRVDESGYAK